MRPKPLNKQRSPWRRVDPGQTGAALAAMGSESLSVHQRLVHDGHLTAVAAIENGEWHLSISHRTNHNPPRPGRYPTWDEIAHARYELLPRDRTFAMLLPPMDEYVAVHDTTFHLHEMPPDPPPKVQGVVGLGVLTDEQRAEFDAAMKRVDDATGIHDQARIR